MRTILPMSVILMLFALVCCPSAGAAPHRNDKVYQAAVANRADALRLRKEIVDIDSGTGDAAGGAKVVALLAGHLRALGADVRTEPAEAPGLPDNLVAGTPALDGLGYVGGDFHTDHEWVDLNSVVPRLYLFTRLLMETGAKPP